MNPKDVMYDDDTSKVSDDDDTSIDDDVSELSDDDNSYDSDLSEEEEEEEEEEEDEGEEEEEEEEEDPWEAWIDDAYDKFKDAMVKNAVKLKNEDETSKEDAYKLTMEEFLPRLNQELRKRFLKFLRHYHLLKRDATFKKIMRSAELSRIDDDMDWDESVTYAAEQRKGLLDRHIQNWTYPFNNEDDDDDREVEEEEEEKGAIQI